MRPLDRDASWRLSLPQRAEKKSRRSETPSQRQLQPWRVERRVGKGKREEADTVQQHTCGDFQDSEIIKLQGVLVFCFGLCRWGVGAHQNRSTFFHLVYKLCSFEMEMVLCFCRCFYFLPFFVSNLQLKFHINSNFGLFIFFIRLFLNVFLIIFHLHPMTMIAPERFFVMITPMMMDGDMTYAHKKKYR